SESELAQAYDSVVNNNDSALYTALLSFFPLIRKFPTPYNIKFNNSIKFINNTSDKIVTEQKSSLVRGKDILSLLVKANEKLPIDEQLTHKELIGQVMTLLVAGHDTTSVSLAWSLYFLAKNPDIQDRLRKEVLDILID
ncbi:15611_t:CDS:2, partial [Cetraspora pellucida]